MTRDLKQNPAARTPFHDAAGEDVLRQISAHWHRLRAGRDVPNRIDMTPGPLSDALAHSFILERVTPSIARFRVAGQAVHQLLNMEPRGMPISALFTPSGRQMLAPLVYDVCEGPEIAEIPLIAQRGLGRTAMRARLLLLPMRANGGEVNRLFGAMVVDGRPSRKALRFDFDQDGELRTETVHPVIRTVYEIMQEPDEEFPRPPRSGLRLVVDNT